MFGLEKLADLFDKTHQENKQYVKQGLQEWVDSSYQKHGEGWQFYGVAATAATLDAVHTFSGAVAGGFVDILRVGEGVKKGTAVGVLQDGLRVMGVSGGVFRVGRLAAASVRIGGATSCTVSSSAKAAALSGRGFLHASFDKLAKGLGGAANVSGPGFKGTTTPLALINELQAMGGRVTQTAVKSIDDVIALTRQAKGPVVFGYSWSNGVRAGKHTMTAFRDLLGRVRFTDQLGRSVSTVPGTVTGVFGQAAIVHDAAIVQVMRAGTFAQVLAANLLPVNPVVMSRIEEKVRELTGRKSPLPPPAARKAQGNGKPLF